MLEPGLRSGDSCHLYKTSSSASPTSTTRLMTYNSITIYMVSPRIPPETKKNKRPTPTPTFKGPSIFFYSPDKTKSPTPKKKISPTPPDLSISSPLWLIVPSSSLKLPKRRWRNGSGGRWGGFRGGTPGFQESTSGEVQRWDDNLVGLVGGFLPNPLWKIWSSKWMISSQKSSEWKHKIFETTTWILLLDEIWLTSW